MKGRTMLFDRMTRIAIPLALFAACSAAGAAASGPGSGAKGDAETLVSQAIRYENAEGVPRDYAKAMDLYCAAARAGNADAQYRLGWMYANGRGMPRDDAQAAHLFHLAAKQGHIQAETMLKLSGSAKTVAPACLTPPKPPQPAQTASIDPAIAIVYPKRIHKVVDKVSPQYEVDPQLVLAFIAVESGFNPRAVSPKNAQGLMQLIPETARRFRVKDAFNEEDNIKGGVRYLQWLLSFFRGNVSLVAAAYNAGEKTVEKYKGIPPYPETRDYVRRITALYRKTSHPYQANLTEASPLVARMQPVLQDSSRTIQGMVQPTTQSSTWVMSP
ncbi:transglycosylase SLT domain-containing protein [Noviherbaspirillum pedocola]|uniref:Transglycosylase SLT domain-containing protein n=1 Tax=Noviherbaspirillum pedocola TaxID=2801341 RepID=A0A934W5T5_9BURK|nr:transglycosylase SLT domain-containing protein [Noviherbaspirillum pedocola]MBK4734305.1 transglycosylase SLT domain-containing protein [Noviherbaspirillum pedocola]